jgi:hypothetical protein
MYNAPAIAEASRINAVEIRILLRVEGVRDLMLVSIALDDGVEGIGEDAEIEDGCRAIREPLVRNTGTEPELAARTRPTSESRFTRCRSVRISEAC